MDAVAAVQAVDEAVDLLSEVLDNFFREEMRGCLAFAPELKSGSSHR
jgi:hypothetical protein